MKSQESAARRPDDETRKVACPTPFSLLINAARATCVPVFLTRPQITEDGFLKQVRIISAVDDTEKYFYRKTPVRADGSFGVTYGFEDHVKDNLINEMQRIESTLALVGNLKRIHWEKATMEYYGETEAEHAQLDIMPAWFFIREMNLNFPTHIETHTLIELVKGKDVFQPLVVPMSFYREGKAEFSVGRYINAYINFYLVLEGLFANGKWDTTGVIKEFAKSPAFTSIAQRILDDIGTNHDLGEGTTKEQMEAELKTRTQPFTVEGLIKLIVKKRGDLHHFSLRSTKQQGTPFNHMQYKTVTFVLLRLASDSLMYYLTEEEKKQKARNKLDR